MASEKLQSFGGLDCRTCGRGHGQAGLAGCIDPGLLLGGAIDFVQHPFAGQSSGDLHAPS